MALKTVEELAEKLLPLVEVSYYVPEGEAEGMITSSITIKAMSFNKHPIDTLDQLSKSPRVKEIQAEQLAQSLLAFVMTHDDVVAAEIDEANEVVNNLTGTLEDLRNLIFKIGKRKGDL